MCVYVFIYPFLTNPYRYIQTYWCTYITVRICQKMAGCVFDYVFCLFSLCSYICYEIETDNFRHMQLLLGFHDGLWDFSVLMLWCVVSLRE